nr:Chain D, Peptide from Major centromere autoantigen B [Homo sapiens]6KDR_E Chain E, Peptide from Major centromere autoantigen B [Homo sapiens]
GPKRRQLTF